MTGLVAELVAAALHWLARGYRAETLRHALTDYEATVDCLDPHAVCCPRHSPRRVDGTPVADSAGRPTVTPAVVPCPAVGAAPGGHFNLN